MSESVPPVCPMDGHVMEIEEDCTGNPSRYWRCMCGEKMALRPEDMTPGEYRKVFGEP